MSDEVVSLFALMDEHLSKTSLNEISENDGKNPTHSNSHHLLPTPPGARLGIPNLFPGNSPMKDFLAEKISMTLKAKEKRKEEEEQRKIEEEMRRLKIKNKQDIDAHTEERTGKISPEHEYLIDLTSSIIKQPNSNQVPVKSANNNETLQRKNDVYDHGEENVTYGLYDVSDTSSQNYSWSSQSVPKETYEYNSMMKPRVEWNYDNEETEMTAEEERLLKEKQKESRWLEEELRKMRIRHEQEYPLLHLLDEVMPQPKPTRVKPQPPVKNKLTKRLVFDKETCLYKEFDPTLPCTTDISYILNSNIKRAKCSTFGKVLCSRVKPYRMTLPYTKETLNSNIARFDFKTKSPGDLYRENQTSLEKKPTKIKIPTLLMLGLMECI